MTLTRNRVRVLAELAQQLGVRRKSYGPVRRRFDVHSSAQSAFDRAAFMLVSASLNGHASSVFEIAPIG